jgi:Uma2 family endonuclease
VQPDVLVARFDELTDKNLPAAPVLAVEVLSPSGRLIDLNLKRAAYQRMGTPVAGCSIRRCPTYWSSNSTPTAEKWPG